MRKDRLLALALALESSSLTPHDASSPVFEPQCSWHCYEARTGGRGPSAMWEGRRESIKGGGDPLAGADSEVMQDLPYMCLVE